MIPRHSIVAGIKRFIDEVLLPDDAHIVIFGIAIFLAVWGTALWLDPPNPHAVTYMYSSIGG